MEAFQVFCSILILAVFHGQGGTSEDPLQIRFSNARLLKAALAPCAVYDGGDTIYIIGGMDENNQKIANISRYSISGDTLDHFGEFIPRAAGTALFYEYEQDIIYLGDNHGSNFEIFRYSTVTRNYTLVNGLPKTLYSMASAWDPDNEWLYIFGGATETDTGYGHHSQEILRYNPSDDHIEHVGQLPEPLEGVATWNNGSPLIFAGQPRSDIFEYNTVNGNVTKWPFIRSLYGHCAVMSDSGHSYLLTGQGSWLRFDPINRIFEEIKVSGWGHISHGACVYVRKLDRIYIFGGMGSYPGTPGLYRDEISYVNLGNPLPEFPEAPSSECDDDEP